MSVSTGQGKLRGPAKQFTEVSLSNHAHKHVHVLTKSGALYFITPSGQFDRARVSENEVPPGVQVVRNQYLGEEYAEVLVARYAAISVDPFGWSASPSETLILDQIWVGGRLTLGRVEHELTQSDTIQRIEIPFAS